VTSLVTDAQVHVWASVAPWGLSYAHGPSYAAEQLLADMASAGVDRAVLVPPSFEGDRNDVCLAAAQRYPDRFAVMGRIPLSSPASSTSFTERVGRPGLLGFRVTFGRGYAGAPDDPAVRWFWAAAERADVPVMVSAAAHLNGLSRVVAAHPGLRLVVDRFGVAHGVAGAELDAALDRLCALAQYGNVAVKATGLPEMADPASVLHRVLDAFGARRVFFASDLTRMPCDYPAVLAVYTAALAGRPAWERDWVLGRGVTEWLRWEETS
jgi:L-fuconolactonase